MASTSKLMNCNEETLKNLPLQQLMSQLYSYMQMMEEQDKEFTRLQSDVAELERKSQSSIKKLQETT